VSGQVELERGRQAAAGLVALALHVQGRALLLQGRAGDGMACLDEAMVAVVAGP
jgi:hypothetical protein